MDYRVPLVHLGAADEPAHQQATGLQLQQLLLNLTVRDVEGRRDLASIRLLPVLRVEKGFFGGHAANDGFQALPASFSGHLTYIVGRPCPPINSDELTSVGGANLPRRSPQAGCRPEEWVIRSGPRQTGPDPFAPDTVLTMCPE